MQGKDVNEAAVISSHIASLKRLQVRHKRPEQSRPETTVNIFGHRRLAGSENLEDAAFIIKAKHLKQTPA